MMVGRGAWRGVMLVLLLASGVARELPAADEREAVATALADAKKLTAQQRYDEARDVYERLAAEHPDQGLVPLARFLYLTGDTARLNPLLGRVRESGFTASPLLRARVLTAGGRGDEARLLLKSMAADARGAEASILLATLLADGGDFDGRDATLASALTMTKSADERRLLLEALVSPHQHSLAVEPALLLAALGAGIESERMDLARAARLADGYLLSQLDRSDYPALKRDWLERGPAMGGGALWVAARLLVKEEAFAQARALLEPNLDAARSSLAWPLLAEQYATLLVSTGRASEAPSWFAEGAKAGSFIAAMEAARLKLASGDTAGAREMLMAIDGPALNATQRTDWFLVRLETEAVARDFDRLADVYASAATTANAENYERFHEVIFSRVLDTDGHHAIEGLVRARFEADAKTPAVLWRLAAEAASQARRDPNAIEALYRCVQARPDDVAALGALAAAVQPVAITVQGLPKEKLLVPESQVAKLGALARASLEALVRADPFETNHYRDLLGVYKALGVDDPAQTAISVVARDSNNPRVKGAAAYALAINGEPAAALALYDQALTMMPGDMDLLMNRASCLTRLDRWSEATEFYRGVLLKGDKSRPFHLHELVARMWAIDQHLNQEDAGLAWFRENVDKTAWRDELLRDLGTLMTNTGRPAQAEEFFTRLVETGTQRRYLVEGYEGLARLYFQQKRADDAARVLAEGAAAFPGDQSVQTSFRLLRVEIMGRAGKLGEAVADIQAMVREMPEARDALFDAAEIAEGLDQPNAARDLYADYLSLPGGDPAKRRMAGERLNKEKAIP